MLTNEGEPLTYKEAKACEHDNKWEIAIQEEIKIKALHSNNTWDLLEMPKGRKVIPNKWVYFGSKYQAFEIYQNLIKNKQPS